MRHAGRGARIGGALLVLSLGSAAIAEPLVSNNNCDKAEFSEMQQFQAELCQAHLGCRLTVALGEKGCAAVRFFRNIGSIFARKPEIDNNDVMDASEPDYPQTPGTRQIVNRVREASRKPGSKGFSVTNQPIRLADGTYASYDGGWDYGSSKASGGGTAIFPDGEISQGNWVDGRLDGPGLTIREGRIFGGEYKNGTLNGPAFSTRAVEGKLETLEGTWVNGNPAGEIVRTFPDGSSVREFWENGKMVVRGERALKGEIPKPVVNPKLAAQQQAAEALDARIASAKNAGELYALADELAEKPDAAGSRKTLRALLSRYPDSPLAAAAAQRLNSTAPMAVSTPPASAMAPAPAASQPGNVTAGYRTRIANPILPPAFHARFTGKGLARATCEAQSSANIAYVDLPANGMRALYRKAAAGMELGLAIYKQCEDDPVAWQQIVQWQTGRDQALKNCEGVSTVANSCYDRYRD